MVIKDSARNVAKPCRVFLNISLMLYYLADNVLAYNLNSLNTVVCANLLDYQALSVSIYATTHSV